MTVTKAELVNILADSTGLSKSEIEVVISSFLVHIIESLENGDRVEIRGFGSFFAKERAQRLVKNPRTSETVTVERRFVPVFRPAKHFRESVNHSRITREEKPST